MGEREHRRAAGSSAGAETEPRIELLDPSRARAAPGAQQLGAGTGTRRRSPLTQCAFTLIELIIVLAILALLITIAAPRYFAHIERTKEATLKQDLVVMRDAIDKFHGDKGRYPESLEELVALRYIRGVPVDPITESVSTWRLVPPPDSDVKGTVYDIKSGAEGKSLDGKPFAEW